jgi:hypothetical protein
MKQNSYTYLTLIQLLHQIKNNNVNKFSSMSLSLHRSNKNELYITVKSCLNRSNWRIFISMQNTQCIILSIIYCIVLAYQKGLSTVFDGARKNLHTPRCKTRRVLKMTALLRAFYDWIAFLGWRHFTVKNKIVSLYAAISKKVRNENFYHFFF